MSFPSLCCKTYSVCDSTFQRHMWGTFQSAAEWDLCNDVVFHLSLRERRLRGWLHMVWLAAGRGMVPDDGPLSPSHLLLHSKFPSCYNFFQGLRLTTLVPYLSLWLSQSHTPHHHHDKAKFPILIHQCTGNVASKIEPRKVYCAEQNKTLAKQKFGAMDQDVKDMVNLIWHLPWCN